MRFNQYKNANMKFIPLFCILFLLSVQTIAQRDPDRLFYALKVEKFRKMKTTGATLTVTGAILVVVGISMIVNSTSSSSHNSSTGTYNLTTNQETGALVYLLGVGSLGAGIPLWIVGGHQQHKYEGKFEKLSVGLNFSPQKTGLTLAYHF